MADSNKLAEVVAMIAERDDDFRPLKDAAVPHGAEPLWPLSRLREILGYVAEEKIDPAVNRAKISAEKAGFSLKEHFVPGDVFNDPGEVYLTKYASLLVTLNADPSKERVAIAQSYFALQADQQRMEDEKRLRTRLDVATENRNLQGVASDAGVANFQRFNGVGLAALYGGLNQDSVKRMKGLPVAAQLLDHAGSEELAANLFRITQTAAALRRQVSKSEDTATETHKNVGRSVRRVIISAGNAPPERLPAAKTKIDAIATKVKKEFKK
jgi:DNA-damage-inducible protein D